MNTSQEMCRLMDEFTCTAIVDIVLDEMIENMNHPTSSCQNNDREVPSITKDSFKIHEMKAGKKLSKMLIDINCSVATKGKSINADTIDSDENIQNKHESSCSQFTVVSPITNSLSKCIDANTNKTPELISREPMEYINDPISTTVFTTISPEIKSENSWTNTHDYTINHSSVKTSPCLTVNVDNMFSPIKCIVYNPCMTPSPVYEFKNKSADEVIPDNDLIKENYSAIYCYNNKKDCSVIPLNTQSIMNSVFVSPKYDAFDKADDTNLQYPNVDWKFSFNEKSIDTNSMNQIKVEDNKSVDLRDEKLFISSPEIVTVISPDMIEDENNVRISSPTIVTIVTPKGDENYNDAKVALPSANVSYSFYAYFETSEIDASILPFRRHIFTEACKKRPGYNMNTFRKMYKDAFFDRRIKSIEKKSRCRITICQSDKNNSIRGLPCRRIILDGPNYKNIAIALDYLEHQLPQIIQYAVFTEILPCFSYNWPSLLGRILVRPFLKVESRFQRRYIARSVVIGKNNWQSRVMPHRVIGNGIAHKQESQTYTSIIDSFEKNTTPNPLYPSLASGDGILQPCDSNNTKINEFVFRNCASDECKIERGWVRLFSLSDHLEISEACRSDIQSFNKFALKQPAATSNSPNENKNYLTDICKQADIDKSPMQSDNLIDKSFIKNLKYINKVTEKGDLSEEYCYSQSASSHVKVTSEANHQSSVEITKISTLTTSHCKTYKANYVKDSMGDGPNDSHIKTGFNKPINKFKGRTSEQSNLKNDKSSINKSYKQKIAPLDAEDITYIDDIVPDSMANKLQNWIPVKLVNSFNQNINFIKKQTSIKECNNQNYLSNCKIKERKTDESESEKSLSIDSSCSIVKALKIGSWSQNGSNQFKHGKVSELPMVNEIFTQKACYPSKTINDSTALTKCLKYDEWFRHVSREMKYKAYDEPFKLRQYTSTKRDSKIWGSSHRKSECLANVTIYEDDEGTSLESNPSIHITTLCDTQPQTNREMKNRSGDLDCESEVSCKSDKTIISTKSKIPLRLKSVLKSPSLLASDEIDDNEESTCEDISFQSVTLNSYLFDDSSCTISSIKQKSSKNKSTLPKPGFSEENDDKNDFNKLDASTSTYHSPNFEQNILQINRRNKYRAQSLMEKECINDKLKYKKDSNTVHVGLVIMDNNNFDKPKCVTSYSNPLDKKSKCSQNGYSKNNKLYLVHDYQKKMHGLHIENDHVPNIKIIKSENKDMSSSSMKSFDDKENYSIPYKRGRVKHIQKRWIKTPQSNPRSIYHYYSKDEITSEIASYI